MRSFAIGAGDVQSVPSGNYVGMRLAIRLRHVTANTAFAGVVFDFSSMVLKLMLTRDKKTREIFNDEALPLILASMFYSSVFDEVKGGGTPTLRRTVVAAAGVDEELEITAKVLLPSIINVMTGDELRAELTCKAGAVNSATVSIAESSIEWEMIEGIGNSTGIPRIVSKTITAGQSSTEESFGDGVKRVVFINNNKFSVLEVDKVLDSVTVKSDKLNRSDTYRELLSDRAGQFPSSTIADSRCQSFVIVDADEDVMINLPGEAGGDIRLHDCRVRLQFNAANVTAAKNYLVAMVVESDTPTAAAAIERNKKHVEANATQVVG